ncbi:MAG TPA: PepSY domain-containing protein [Actinomycetaceae bacterium]|nr:PepSY domain-containing protein [Actinomycetaceae bacterium]
MRTSTAMSVSAAAALALTLAACGGDDAEQPPQPPAGDIQSEDVPGATTEAPAAPSPDATDASPSPEANGSTTGSSGDDAAGPNAGVFAAIELAESEAGGTAFEINREDDEEEGWEVSVAVGDDEVDVHLDPAGTEVLRTDRDDDLDDDERDALAAATITMADAIRIAFDEVDGALDDVDLDDENGTFAWEVNFEGDTEVYVAVTGEVLRVDRD